MSENATYKEFTEVPEYTLAAWKGDVLLSPKGEKLLWSGKNGFPPPPIGSHIKVTMNAIGLARVTGYFAEDGWLGLLVLPLQPPAWLVKQNGYNKTGHIFGAEFAPEILAEPEIDGPTVEQLAALDAFAKRHGRRWKKTLNEMWMNGADCREPDGHLLRQVRNDYGPSWLQSKKNPIKASA